MASVAQPHHHHRSTTKANNKPFKTRHATKGAIKERQKGKVEAWEKGSRKTPHQQVMSKIDRRNHAKQIRINKLADRREEKSVFEGKDGAPRVVAVIPLCEDVDSAAVVGGMNESVDVEGESQSGPWRVEVSRFKQRLQYLQPERELLACLNACRLADFVVFVLSATQEVDELGEQLLRCIESQGVSTVVTGVHNLSLIEPSKRRPDVVKSLKSFITHFFAAQDKVHDLGNRQDCSNLMRSLCTTTPKGIRWREDKSWMVVEDVQWEGSTPVVTGVVRGKGLKADRLVQVGDWGDFQIGKIAAAPVGSKRKVASSGNAMNVDIAEDGDTLDQPTDQQDDLAELAPEEAIMDDIPTTTIAPSERRGVLLDDHHYFDEDDAAPAPKRLPRGTSKYQSAWYLDDLSDSGSDLESVDDDDDMDVGDPIAAGPADGNFAAAERAETEFGGPSEYPQSEMFDDRAPDEEAEEIEAYRQQRREEAAEDLEFPDEIELPPNVLARERLARYRGLKSLRTSPWDTEEDKAHEPDAWNRLLEVADYKSAKNRVLKDTLSGGVKPGTRVRIHLLVEEAQVRTLQDLARPDSLFSLLRHEHKRTAANCSITLSSDYPEPLKSKEQIFLQCGPRRLIINPLFSQAGNTPNNVHKFDRYLHPGRTAVASFVGPLIWGSVPCLFLKRRVSEPSDAVSELADALSHSPTTNLELIGTGTVLPPSTSRVIAKRIILTGEPFKIHKKLVTIRYMFFNNEDVMYFKALQLWTRRGRSGFIKETLGTHGYFKATFDSKINPMDGVAVSLYKRVWPREAITWRPSAGEVTEVVQLAPVDGMVE